MINITIEGQIGVGKTTFISKLAKEFVNDGLEIDVLPEPVAEWVSFGAQKENMLKLMYSNPTAHSFNFQLTALLTKVEQIKRTTAKNVIVERSILAQKYVFLPILKENGSINDLQLEICERYMTVFSEMERNTPSVIIYLRVTPEKAMERIKLRNRMEEEDIELEYLKRIHCKYENWLPHEGNVLWVDANDFGTLDAKHVFDRLKEVMCFDNLKRKMPC